MKKILITLLLLTGLRASALDWTYSTNLFWWITSPTNIFCGSNSTDPARDSYIVIWNKLNADIDLMWSRIQNSTNGGGITNFVFTTTNVPATSNATIVVTGVTNNIAYCFAQIPAGATGPAGTNTVTVTNTITTYNFTNQIFSSRDYLVYGNTNLTMTTSNYLGLFTNLTSAKLTPPILGGSDFIPGTNVFEQLWYATNGSSVWSTNLIYATNGAKVAVVGAGGGVGSVMLYANDHPELAGRHNYLNGQHLHVDAPGGDDEVVPYLTMKNAILNATGGQWIKSVDTNYVYHYSYSVNGVTLADFQNREGGISINSSAVDGTGTNFQFTIYATNLVTGWHIEATTNLANTYGWYPFSNYTTNISAGVVTFTIPIDFTLAYGQYFRANQTLVTAFLLSAPLVVLTNTISHSTNSTYGYGAGVWAADTNYFYVSVATNTWRRISIPTNTW